MSAPRVATVITHRRQMETAAAVRWWVGLKDLLLLHLTGELVTELSSASATGLLGSVARDVQALREEVRRLREQLDSRHGSPLDPGPPA